MNDSNEDRLKIAVFIDFDNIAIGVKQSLNRNFDVGAVLEAIKEKGEVIAKIAYGDWKRAEDYSRAMTQHAVQMVQRNLTPGGDKNGADIALALDALEMAFTRDHINAFVIVGGDSDFIALVEKLKQYDKTVFVVGGRAFTSVILQKNCHEFISYENLVGIQTGTKKAAGKTQISSPAALDTALPLIRRALKVLSDREVSPQLGLLKSTLLQLDSTFSERDYGVSSFRDFIQKLADAGHVNLKQVDRSLLVELKEVQEEDVRKTRNYRDVPTAAPEPTMIEADAAPEPGIQEAAAAPEQPPAIPAQPSEAIRVLEGLLQNAKAKPHWPMYLRTFKQYLRSLQPPFDERQHGISSTYDLVRLAHREGLVRVERNRQGILRIYPTDRFPRAAPEQPAEEPAQVEAAAPEIQAPSAESRILLPEPAIQTELPSALPDIPLPELVEEGIPQVQPEEVAEPPVQKPQPRRRKKAASGTSRKSNKSGTRKARSGREKAKEGGLSKAATS